MPTRSETISRDIIAALCAREPLIWIVTREEDRIEPHLFNAAIAAQFVPRTWDADQGVCDYMGNKQENIGGSDIDATLTSIRERALSSSRGRSADRGVWILRDLTPWITGTIGINTQRKLRNLAKMLPKQPLNSAQAIIVISPSGEIPPELSNHAMLITWPLPDREEVSTILQGCLDAQDNTKIKAPTNGTFDAAIDAALGLTGEEANRCFSRSLVQFRLIDPPTIASEKKRVVAKEKIEWYDPIPGGLDAVGGLDALKTWLTQRKLAYSLAARTYGLPAPRGILIVGISGCGKSLTAKATATAWGVPLLKLDLGALLAKYVGDSQTNLRRALQVIETIGRSVVWLDEIEKALAGATQGAADGGVSADVLGTLLTWMQERSGEAFIIATANDITSITEKAPELLRRFDEIFFVDTPNLAERREILCAALREYKRDINTVTNPTDLELYLVGTNDFTGDEIGRTVRDALSFAFADGEREPTTRDLIRSASTVVPLTSTAKEKIEALRTWAAGRARRATTPQETTQSTSQARKLSL